MLEGLSKHRSDYHTCAVALISKTLDKKDFELLEKYIADETWGIRGLSEALAKRGVDLGPRSIQKHRHKICTCFRGK